MKFDTFINEKAFVPNTDFVYVILNRIKNKLINAKTNVECAKILREAFKSKWFSIVTTKEESYICLVPTWAINGALTSASGEGEEKITYELSRVNISLGIEFCSKLNAIKTDKEWKSFMDAFEYTVAHEYIHKYQLSHVNIDTAISIFNQMKFDTDKAYLSMDIEIMAFALQSLKEFIAAGYSPEEILERVKKPLDKNLKPALTVSDVFRRYSRFVEEDYKVWKKFSKNITDYIMQFIK
jgi:hypothetical protein